jgi:hypothetical protein
MYTVIYKSAFSGYQIIKTETIEEAKENIERLLNKGYRDVYLAKEIPMNITFSIEVSAE